MSDWFLSHLVAIFVLGVFAVLVSFKCSYYGYARNVIRFLGLFAILATLVGLIATATSTPGRVPTVDQPDSLKPDHVSPKSPIDRLRLTWNSDRAADWPAAGVLAQLSEGSYLSPLEAEARYRSFGFADVITIEHESMLGYVVRSGDVVVLVFRGTDDPADWIINLDTRGLDTPNGVIHRGFQNAYQNLKAQIKAAIGERPVKHFWITGHSLGGAVGVAAAYDVVANDLYELDGLITFGQPMVAKKQLAEHLDKVLESRFAHYVNESDIVPRSTGLPTQRFACLVFRRGNQAVSTTATCSIPWRRRIS
jgi:hypothetical protein